MGWTRIEEPQIKFITVLACCPSPKTKYPYWEMVVFYVLVKGVLLWKPRQNDGVSVLHFDGYARMTEFKNGCGSNVCGVSAIGTVIAIV